MNTPSQISVPQFQMDPPGVQCTETEERVCVALVLRQELQYDHRHPPPQPTLQAASPPNIVYWGSPRSSGKVKANPSEPRPGGENQIWAWSQHLRDPHWPVARGTSDPTWDPAAQQQQQQQQHHHHHPQQQGATGMTRAIPRHADAQDFDSFGVETLNNHKTHFVAIIPPVHHQHKEEPEGGGMRSRRMGTGNLKQLRFQR
ncbi:hypothetical protein F5Y09DRAFT_346433 [Xylaria sp. FL1042]|nr:hypothetical protein F5Y09DRAFT_346433 [Xylaria sp. FL1042]